MRLPRLTQLISGRNRTFNAASLRRRALQKSCVSTEALEDRLLLTMEVEPNDTIGNATLFTTANDTLEGEIADADDVDYFVANFVRGQTFQIVTTNLNNSTFTNAPIPGVTIVDANGEVKAESRDARTLRFTIPYTGQFFVRFDSQTNVGVTVGEYAMQTSVVLLTGTSESEPNDVPADATDVDGARYILGEIADTDDVDHFFFEGNTDEIAVLQFSDAPELNPAARLFAPDGTLAAESVDGLGLVHTLDADGDWVIEFSSANPNGTFTNEYIARLDQRIGINEPDLTNEFSNATIWDVTTSNTWATGTLTDLNDVDVYQFETTELVFEQFRWGDNDLFSMQNHEIVVFNQFGQILQWTYDGTLNRSAADQIVRAGTYYVTVRASSPAGLGAYSLRGNQSVAFSSQRDVPLYFLDFDEQISHLNFDWVRPFQQTEAIPLVEAMFEARYDVFDIDTTLTLPDASAGEYVGQGVGDFGDIGAGGWGGGNYGFRRPQGDGVTGNDGANWNQLYNGPTATLIHEAGHATGLPHARHPLNTMAYTNRLDQFPIGSYFPFNGTDQHNADRRMMNLRDYLDWALSAGAQVFEQEANDDLTQAQDLMPDLEGMMLEFVDGPDIPTATTPTTVRLGHFNGDSNLDVVYSDSDTNRIYLRMGNGDGTFGGETSYDGGGNHGWWTKNLVTGFFDDDQDLDVAHINSGSNNVAIFMGNGDGTLAAPVTYNLSSQPVAITTTDINGDDEIDLAITHSNDRLSILTGNDDGTFDAAVTQDAGDYPIDVMSIDVDGDDDFDIVTANTNDGTMSVFLNNGGTLDAPVHYAAGAETYGVTGGDFDGNGTIDLVAANRNAETITIFSGDGAGGFQSLVTLPTSDQPYEIDTADMDNDGHADLIVTNYNTASQIFIGNGDLTFSSPISVGKGRGKLSQDLGDLNNDGRLDIISSNIWDDELFVSLSKENDPRNDRVVLYANIDSPSNSDFYSFTSLADQTWEFDIDAAEYQRSLNSKISIQDADGNLIVENLNARDRDTGIDSVDPSITHTFTDAGTYFVVVESEFSSIGDYRLKVTPGEALDKDGPKILYSLPQPGSSQESTKQLIFWTNDQIDPDSLVNSIRVEGVNAGVIEGEAFFDPVEQMLVWNADQQLTADTYTVMIDGGATGIKDLNGNWLDGETDGEPSFPEVSGDDNPGGDFLSSFTINSGDNTAARVNSSNYWRHFYNRGRFTLNFSDQLDIGSAQDAQFTLRGAGTDGNFNTVDDTLAPLDSAYSAHRSNVASQLTLYSRGVPDAGEYRVEGGVIDEDGFLVTVAEEFTIAAETRFHGPSVIDVSAQSNGAIFAPTTDVTVTFSGAIDTATLTTSSFKLLYSEGSSYYDGSATAVVDADGTIEWDPVRNQATFSTAEPLQNGYYLLTLEGDGANGIRNVDGHLLDGEFLDSNISGTTLRNLWEDAPSGDGRPGGDYVAFFTVSVPELHIEIVEDSVSEDAGDDSVSAVITRINTDQTVPLTVTLTSSSDTELIVPATVEFPENVLSMTVFFDVVDDFIIDSDSTITVTIEADDFTSDMDTLQIVNNDFAGISFVETDGATIVSETGTSDLFRVTLDAEPLSTVVVRVTSDNPDEATVNPTSLIFTPSNWNSPQDVTVTGVDDEFADGDRQSQIDLIVDPDVSDDDFDAVSNSVTVTTTNDDPAAWSLAQTDGTTEVSENGAPDSLMVVLLARPLNEVVFATATDDDTEATAAPEFLTFDSANWNIPQQIAINPVDDFIVDGEQQPTITVSVDPAQSDAAFTTTDAQSFTVRTFDDDEAAFVIQQTGGGTTVTDNGTTDTFQVVLDREPLNLVVFDLELALPGEAELSVTELTFSPNNWSTPQLVTVTGIDDPLINNDIETSISIRINALQSDDAFDDLAPQTVALTVLNDDFAAFTITETDDSSEVAETGTSDLISIVLDKQPITDVVFEITSADSGEVTATPTNVTFTTDNWNSPQDVTLIGVDDVTMDANQTVDVSISVVDSQSNDAFDDLAPQTVSVTNINDDSAAFTVVESDGTTTVSEDGSTDNIVVVLDVRPETDVVFRATLDQSSEASLDNELITFTSANWDLPQSFVLTGVDDFVDDGDQTSEVTIAVQADESNDFFDALPDQTVSVLTTNDDESGFIVTETDGGTQVVEGGATDQFSVRLTAQPASAVRLDINSSLPADVTAFPAFLDISPDNWDLGWLITVTATDDMVADGVTAQTIRVSVGTGSDAAFDSVPDQSLNVEITDNETAGILLTETSEGTTVTENGASDTIGVALSAEPLSNVVIDLALTGTDVASISATQLTFTPANWNDEQSVTVTAVDNMVVDGERSTEFAATVNVTDSDPAFASAVAATVDVTVSDDEIAGITILETDGSTIVDESGSTDTIEVALDAQPQTDVILSVTSANTNEVTLDPAQLTFTAANWNVPQTVTFTGVDDTSADGDQVTAITLSVAANSDAAFLTLEDSEIQATNTDLTASFLLDIDEDSAALALSDGILAIRYLAGFQGNTLVAGAVNPDGNRTAPTDIQDYLDQNAPTFLDIDQDGQTLALSDGILMIRYLAGFRGSSLVNGAVNQNGERTDADAITEFLDAYGSQPGGGSGGGQGQASAAPAVALSAYSVAPELDSGLIDDLFNFANGLGPAVPWTP